MAAPVSLVHPDCLDEVFDIIDANGDGVLTVNEFITALRTDPEVGRLLDLGTVDVVAHDEAQSRDAFEKVFTKLDTDSSLTVTRDEFKNYFCPDDDAVVPAGGKRHTPPVNHDRRARQGDATASASNANSSSTFTLSTGSTPSSSPRLRSNTNSSAPSRENSVPQPSNANNTDEKQPMEPISRAVSVFSQSSTHSAHRSVPSDDWVSPPPPQGGCCGFGAKRRGAAPRQAPARATAYVAPVVTRPVPASDVVTRSPPSPFKNAQAAGVARCVAALARCVAQDGAKGIAQNGFSARAGKRATRRSFRENDPLAAVAVPRDDAAAACLAAGAHAGARAGVAVSAYSGEPSDRVCADGGGKSSREDRRETVYNISDDELLAIKEELLVLREQVLAKAESLKSSNLKMHEMEKENRDLRAEYNLQSLKQEMLVHMWSMHMLD
eukprot:CAMPEP_0197121158 /NCGR_PEP_ID=MMETSP1390-20130617/3357_1 /TAXON_ID=38833 /ORGANISM="Micromonas sp., Strain CCMP2099" /LENGTH=437 /DNA_ID=CAMNT_0042563031 /DNA_START=26 /DNA_END=1336 /DNA_ORIENTATION=+